MHKMVKTFVPALVSILIPLAYADQGSFTDSGGGSVPPGTLSISGSNLSFVSNDGTTVISATFTSTSSSESCSGGGKGGHTTCFTSFTGYFSGTLTVTGSVQAINGVTYQGAVVGGATTGVTAYNSAYTPFYFSNTGQILRSDDLNGTNLISYGTQGAGTGQFYGAYGIAVDSAGRIYIADTYNSRIVRIDNMNGDNWTEFGSYGTDIGQFSNPQGISIDPSGRIYVVDAGNNRLVRMDDMNGTNWTTASAISSAPVAFDSSGRLYFADAGNRRIVRMDDMNGTNFTTLTQSPVIGIYIYSFASPLGVAVDASGRIYVVDGSSPASVIRVDDMTGANWTSISLGSSATPHSIAVDASGMVLVGGGGAQIVDNAAGVLVSSSALTQFYGPYYVFGATPVPLPSPRPSAISLNPPALTFSQNVGTTGSQTVTITNFGGSMLDIGGISASDGFGYTTNCLNNLVPGSNCTVTVTFTPTVTGPVNGFLTVNDDSGNLGASQTISLSGLGTAPVASVSPASLSFSSQIEGTTSTAKTVTLLNTGTGPMQVSTVTATAPFSQTNTCSGSVAPSASCTVSVSFTPTAVGSASGTLTFVDNAGTQTVSLTGTGSAPVTLSASTLSFGTLAVGNTSSAKTVTLTNRAPGALSFSSIVASAGFAIASNTCGTGIAAGANCTVGVTFSPTTTGAATGTLTFIDDAANSPQTVSLSGTATGSAPVTVSSSTLNLGTVAVGATSAAGTVTLTNRQSVALSFAGTSPATTAGFAIASNTCGTSIAAGASCTVGVTFTPTATGAATGTLTFTDGASNSPQKVSLTGTGSSPVTVAPGTLNLGTVAVGATSASQTVTVTNNGTTAVTNNGVTATGDFADTTTCSSSLAAGNSCTVTITFTPVLPGTRTGTLTINLSTGAQTVSLTGTGLTGSGSQPGLLSLTPATLNFSGYTIGDNPSQKVTVTNSSGASVGIAGIAMSGDPSLTQRNNCGSVVASGATCAITVTFAPVAYGTFTGTLAVTEASGAQDTVSVTGTSSQDN
ncbi:MAG: choice-of-anchor D domain-containing protein [Bryobacteraceae bacterium]|jgi:sugar lactone lactonase YvrE